MRHPVVSFFLVFVQFAAVLYIVLTSPFHLLPTAASVLFMAGVGLGLWAVVTMRHNRWYIVPDVPQEGRLVITGPYRFIRHPMYAGVLLACLGLFLEHPTDPRLLAFLLLLVDLNIKYRYEDRLLSRAFPDAYPAYKRRTAALIPFLY